jgi:maleylacetoacetate isomerase
LLCCVVLLGGTPAPRFICLLGCVAMETCTLHSYYRSSCSWRVRLALKLKNIPFKILPVNLLKNEQTSAPYLKINPSGTVPTLEIGNEILTQSLAIVEYLEEAFPSTFALLPAGPKERALVRRLSLIIAADCQPLQNFCVQTKIMELYGRSRAEVQHEWAAYFIERGLEAFDSASTAHSGRFSFGETVGLADICLIPQLYNARRFGIDVEGKFARLAAIEEAFKLDFPEAYTSAHPDSQPDGI